MKIALAQINPTVGDLAGNANLIVSYSRRAAESGADLVIFPEMCVTGYPPLDLLDYPEFIDATEETVEWIKAHVPGHLGVLIGAPIKNPDPEGKKLLNAALLFENGQEIARVCKMLLPTYDIFDESRYFSAASRTSVVEYHGIRLGISVCEDMWNWEGFSDYQIYADNPLERLAQEGAELFINLSASPFSEGKHAQRNALVQRICDQYRIPFVLVNQVGANTELVFDGDSRVQAADGRMLNCAPSFEEALIYWDTAELSSPSERAFDDADHDVIADLYEALILGIRDYVEKTGVFDKVLVGLSGGIDSAVTCALAVDALGSDRVFGITMPSAISSVGSVDDSRDLAKNLGIGFDTISIVDAVNAFESMLNPLFEGTTRGIAEENIQARARGVTLMAVSNKFGYLLLTTGNKSELSMGYATLYGDMSGGLAVISDVFKTQVYRLAEYMNEKAGRILIPRSTIEKPPSAELSVDQKDEDSLPPYPVLDEILRQYVEERNDVDQIVRSTGFEEHIVRDVLKSVDRSEYKRRQAPPGLRVSGKAFGMGRRLPIVMRYDRASVDALLSKKKEPAS